MTTAEVLCLDACTARDASILAEASLDARIRLSYYIDTPRPEDRLAASWLSENLGGSETGRYCFVAKTRDNVAGVVRFEGNLISYFLLPAFQGKGHGKRMVAESCDRMFKTSGTGVISATVLRENVRSRAILEYVGFQFHGLGFSRQSRTAILEYILKPSDIQLQR